MILIVGGIIGAIVIIIALGLLSGIKGNTEAIRNQMKAVVKALESKEK